MAIWRSLSYKVRTNGGARARFVFNDHLLAERHSEFLAQDARHHIGKAARCRGHDDAHRFGGVVLGKRHGG